MKKVSIIDVAKRAGVSVSTVSLVLRQKGKISDATIKKVQAAIHELGYVHNVAAANLRSSTSNLIGLLLRDFSDSFSIKVMASIVQELETQGFMVFLAQPLNEHEHLERCLLSFKQQGVAGVIYLASDVSRDTLPTQIHQCPLPLIVVSQSPVKEACNLVLRDNQQAARLATRYLIERGHRYIAYLGGQENNLIRQQRLIGFRNTLTRYGIASREEFTPACDDNTRAASIAARQLLEKNNAITALLCHSPDAMIGCINGIQQVGRTVGKDVFLTQQVALIGFEDMLHINLTSPAFTYVSSASEETGRQAATLMIRKLKEPDLQTQSITLSGQLIIRESA
ncbi:Mal regulon transcriptional regulator MalI [Salmonella enterica subsp. salamae]|uniref:Maltose regulon repressor n=3 Tax=Salmonella enterica TaxID=28901 RepID=A0A379QR44_SALER|nr:Mal regulon transcriptional regulator MalI [Salmonella enterica]ECC1481720.1 Mal regulon transcriptional regulator MalI [Salmonella enterica subsp. salamae]EHM1751122.1 Mal regulon transcriptional regulator MalI [Salmonella enterica subsp. salamae serovar 40:c:e,n,x,z15]HCM1999615.1 Mal regulon transcriptional regulator MalI [Salmonella enterica subsp. salamae serovar [1],40:z35:e,n,x,z15]ASG90172.1 LacI family transcriptional regulator [Salmonella enterica subsp. salamae serovar 55:k:z39 st